MSQTPSPDKINVSPRQTAAKLTTQKIKKSSRDLLSSARSVDYIQYFHDMYSKISHEEKNLAELCMLKERMEIGKCNYHEDDFDMLNKLMAEKEANILNMRMQYQEKSDMYTKVLLGLKTTIDTRAEDFEYFDKNTSVFKNNVELRDFFVKKQSVLNTMYIDTGKGIID